MIQFRHKKHMHQGKDTKIVIYYNISDIFLGTVLMILVVFFIHNYLSNELRPYKNYSQMGTSDLYQGGLNSPLTGKR